MKHQLGYVIKEYIKNNGIKQNFLAEKMGVSEQAFTEILNCKRKIIADEYYYLCKALGVPMNYFYEKLEGAE